MLHVLQGSHRLAKYTIYLKMKVLSWKVIENELCLENRATRCPEKLCVARKPRITFQSLEFFKIKTIFYFFGCFYEFHQNVWIKIVQIFVKNWVLWCQVSEFETDFRCSPEKYFWKSCHSVKSTWKPLLGLDVFCHL